MGDANWRMWKERPLQCFFFLVGDGVGAILYTGKLVYNCWTVDNFIAINEVLHVWLFKKHKKHLSTLARCDTFLSEPNRPRARPPALSHSSLLITLRNSRSGLIFPIHGRASLSCATLYPLLPHQRDPFTMSTRPTQT